MALMSGECNEGPRSKPCAIGRGARYIEAGRMQRLTAVLVVGAVGLAACGGGQGGAGAASTGSRSGPGTSASASRALIVVAGEPAPGYQNSPATVRPVRPGGALAGPPTPKPRAQRARAGG